MRINYVSVAPKELGSFRYQLLNPGLELRRIGHQVTFSEEPNPNQDVYVFHKHFRQDREPEMFRKVKGKKVFVVSDYHFNNQNGNHYRQMCKIADVVVAATKKLAYYIKLETGVDAKVVYDTWGIEFDEYPPNHCPHDEPVLLWFGHTTNLKGLQDNIKAFKGCKLMIVTNSDKKGIIPYSIENMKEAFSRCDAVIIPQNINEPGKQTKTHNRIVDSFRSGKFVIASPVDSYLDFMDWAFIGDMREGIEWFKNQGKQEIEGRILKAQEFIRKTFDPKIIACQWEGVFNG